jgi:excisionase family DNA binding protein
MSDKMSQLLTTRQVQEILKVDRITVYRMIGDGRLTGVKIGNHWRFHQQEIDRFLGSTYPESLMGTANEPLTEFPSGCVEKVEELVAGILGIGVTTVNLDGELLNAIVNPNPFCQLIQAGKSGASACRNCWKSPAESGQESPAQFQVCHAGLSFFRAPIQMENRTVAWVISGQFSRQTVPAEECRRRVDELSRQHRIPRDVLLLATGKIPVLSPGHQAQVVQWSPRLAHTIQSILGERIQLTARLQKISEISSVQPVFTGVGGESPAA